MRNSDKAAHMARLYVRGPVGLAGNWDACAKAAGYSRAPRRDNAEVRSLIEAEIAQPDEVPNPFGALLAEAESMSWEELADRAKPLMAQVAAGTLWATTQQVQALKEVLNRGQGKAGLKPQELPPTGLIVLPVMGGGHDAVVCPNCLAELDKETFEIYKRLREELLAANA